MAQGNQRSGRRSAVKRQHPEMALHKACAQLLDIRQKQSGFFWTTIGHGGGGKVRGAQLKAMGVKRGVADILICKRDFIAWIELKSPKGVPSPDQMKFHDTVVRFDHFHAVVKSVDDLAFYLRIWNL